MYVCMYVCMYVLSTGIGYIINLLTYSSYISYYITRWEKSTFNPFKIQVH